MVRRHGRLSPRAADRRRTGPLLAAVLAVGLATGVAVAPGWAATGVAVTPDWAATAGPDGHSGEWEALDPPGEPPGDPEEPTSPPPATVEPPGETSPPPSPSPPAPSVTTGVPTPSGGPPTTTRPPLPTYAPPSPPPTTTPMPTGSPSRPVEVRADSGGITLRADEVALDVDGGAGLNVRLGNSGPVDAQGRVEVVLPAGVTVPAPPADCVIVDPTRTRCDLGSVSAGRTEELRLPVTATPSARRAAPLAGVVIGQLEPRDGPSRRVRLDLRITAAEAEPAVVPPPGALDVPSALPAGAASAEAPATTWSPGWLIALAALPVLIALILVTVSLRRRMAVPDAGLGVGSAQPGGAGPEPEGGIWFRPQRPARRVSGDLDYGGPGESPQ
ncbi:hypothetical protein [Micromonospora endophytica]|uniref:Uncharacterized protein n=1 Tax=Micromonospora endophytica TaxID=515350 RepID=A0A2W2D0I3_9ACTN|nr:hypothetical protein [Micromonospora endophytica]PZF97278.1 hypothetical protein C1I93_12245 [Micromonospora endophytica]RIW43348.1 hypothetical protein D3H59_20475 [Micromonospora endophytica]BCJ58765.1 hypothetical protein Jiend_21870 [Micromonospora endophytica]